MPEQLSGDRVVSTLSRYAFILVLLSYFIYLVNPGLLFFFTPDDAMNLFKAWVVSPSALTKAALYFWSGGVRPLGQIAYRLMYGAFGWRPYPFHLTCLVLLSLNVILTYLLFLKLAKSRTFRILASLIAVFHGALMNIYANAGTIYDILCLTFVLSALVYYVSVRSKAPRPTLMNTIIVAILTIAAFESKEIGFMLPPILFTFEIIFYKPASISAGLQWPLKVILPAAICVAFGVLGLHHSSDHVIFETAAYTPLFTLRRYLETSVAYFTFLFFRSITFTRTGCLWFLLGSVAAALVLRLRLALFGWALFFLALLPLSFAPPRFDGYILYVPYTGAAIYCASMLTRCLQMISGRKVLRTGATIALCALIVTVQLQQRSVAERRGFGPGGMLWIEEMTNFASASCQSWPSKARIAVLNNPFGKDYEAQFVFNLTCKTRDLKVETVTYKNGDLLLSSPLTNYSSIVLYENNTYRTVTLAELYKQR